MKTKIFIAVMAVSLFTMNLQAQKNVVRWRPMSMAWGSYDFMYERALGDGISVALKAGFIYVDQASRMQKSYNDPNVKVNKFLLSGISLLPEFRLYFGSNSTTLKGMYVNPYLKWWNAGLGISVTDLMSATTVAATGSVNIYGVGVGLGKQWLIGDRVSIDWNFIGLGYDSYNIAVKYPSMSTAALDAAEEVAAQLNEISSGFAVIPAAGGIKVSKTGIPMIGFKTCLSIGVAF